MIFIFSARYADNDTPADDSGDAPDMIPPVDLRMTCRGRDQAWYVITRLARWLDSLDVAFFSVTAFDPFLTSEAEAATRAIYIIRNGRQTRNRAGDLAGSMPDWAGECCHRAEDQAEMMADDVLAGRPI